jgi:hypothetical protein
MKMPQFPISWDHNIRKQLLSRHLLSSQARQSASALLSHPPVPCHVIIHLFLLIIGVNFHNEMKQLMDAYQAWELIIKPFDKGDNIFDFVEGRTLNLFDQVPDKITLRFYIGFYLHNCNQL